MRARDRNEPLSKEGCGRVVFHRQLGLVHSYTLECGYHANNYDNALQTPHKPGRIFEAPYRRGNNAQKLYEPEKESIFNEDLQPAALNSLVRSDPGDSQSDLLGYCPDPLEDPGSPYYAREIVFYQPETYYNLGKNILVSLLDLWNKNPYSRVTDLNSLRVNIAERLSKLDRFRKEQSGIKTKQKRIVELIEEQCYAGWRRKNALDSFCQTAQSLPRREFRRTQARLPFSKQLKSSDKEALKNSDKEVLNKEVLKNSDKEVLKNSEREALKSSDKETLRNNEKEALRNPRPGSQKTELKAAFNLRIRNVMIGRKAPSK